MSTFLKTRIPINEQATIYTPHTIREVIKSFFGIESMLIPTVRYEPGKYFIDEKSFTEGIRLTQKSIIGAIKPTPTVFIKIARVITILFFLTKKLIITHIEINAS